LEGAPSCRCRCGPVNTLTAVWRFGPAGRLDGALAAVSEILSAGRHSFATGYAVTLRSIPRSALTVRRRRTFCTTASPWCRAAPRNAGKSVCERIWLPSQSPSPSSHGGADRRPHCTCRDSTLGKAGGSPVRPDSCMPMPRPTHRVPAGVMAVPVVDQRAMAGTGWSLKDDLRPSKGPASDRAPIHTAGDGIRALAFRRDPRRPRPGSGPAGTCLVGRLERQTTRSDLLLAEESPSRGGISRAVDCP
jgi:hypothetical protein